MVVTRASGAPDLVIVVIVVVAVVVVIVVVVVVVGWYLRNICREQ